MRAFLPCLLALLCLGFAACSPNTSPAPSAFDLKAIHSDLVATNQLRWKRGVARLVAGGTANITKWSAWLSHENRGVREGVAHALGDLAPADATIVDALIVAFDDDDDYVRWKAARALGRIGRTAKKALPMLRVAALADRETEIVRAVCKRAVAEIEGDSG